MRSIIAGAGLGLVLLFTNKLVLAQDAAGAATGSSADALQEVVVTAERREENLQKTPMNVTVVSGQSIAELGKSDVQQVLSGLPGVYVIGQVRGFVPSIRGLGTDLPPGSAQGSVATEVDNVYDIRAEAGRIGFFDLARVEVLAGPQGTLYGVNADGGVVNIISNNPVLNKYQSSGAITIGNYNLVRSEGMANVPLSDNSALRFAVAGISRDGFLTNVGADDDVGQGGRVKYLYQPSDNFSLLLGTELARLGGKGQGGVASYTDSPTTSNPWVDNSAGTTASRINQWDRYHSTKYWGELHWNLGLGTLTFLPSYKDDYDSESTCGMGSSCALVGDPIKLKQNSEELRFSSNSKMPLAWTVGFYHWGYLQASTAMGGVNPPPVGIYSTSNGVFGETTYSFTDKARLITGVRETWDWKHETDIVGATGTWSHFDYRAGLEYDLTPESMEYATVATGYRPGGFNSDPNFPIYKTEVVRDIEVGSKNRFFDDRLQVNADAFFYDFTNYQLHDGFAVGSCTGLARPAPTYNLGARNFGVDLGVIGAITNEDTATASVSYADAKFTSSQVISYNPPNSCPAGAPANAVAIVDTYSINSAPEPRSPKLSGSFSYEHRFVLASGASIAAQPSMNFAQQQYINPVENIYSHQGAYSLYNFTMLYRSIDGKWTLSAWSHNLGNTPIKTNLNPMILGEPRTYGVTASVNID